MSTETEAKITLNPVLYKLGGEWCLDLTGELDINRSVDLGSTEIVKVVPDLCKREYPLECADGLSLDDLVQLTVRDCGFGFDPDTGNTAIQLTARSKELELQLGVVFHPRQGAIAEFATLKRLAG